MSSPVVPQIPKRGEHELVDLEQVDPGFKLDVRYARWDNFVARPVYSVAKVFLQAPVAQDLLRVHKAAAKDGFGVLLFDGYRPWAVTKIFWDSTPDHLREFVADPFTGSVHNRGCAVDLSLYHLDTGLAAEMPSDFDELTERSYADYAGATETQKKNRALLRHLMETHGFRGIKSEWWHFNHKLLSHYPVMDIDLRELVAHTSASR